jgi:hypothetical protein
MKGHTTDPYVRKTLSDLLLCRLSATGSKIFREDDSRVRDRGWQVIPRHGFPSRRYRQLNPIDRTDAVAGPGVRAWTEV